MHTESTSDERGSHDAETGSVNEAIERHLRTALDASVDCETRFHLRQALQLVAALDER